MAGDLELLPDMEKVICSEHGSLSRPIRVHGPSIVALLHSVVGRFPVLSRPASLIMPYSRVGSAGATWGFPDWKTSGSPLGPTTVVATARTPLRRGRDPRRAAARAMHSARVRVITSPGDRANNAPSGHDSP